MIPQVDTGDRDPSACVKGTLIAKLDEGEPADSVGIVACREYTTTTSDNNAMIVCLMKWVPETIASALGRTAVEPNDNDFTLLKSARAYRDLSREEISSFDGRDYLDESGETFEAMRYNFNKKDAYNKFEDNGLPLWIRDAFLDMTYGQTRDDDRRPLGLGSVPAFSKFEALRSNVQVVVNKFKRDVGTDTEREIYQVWAACASNMRRHTNLLRVTMKSVDGGHICLADLRDPNHVKMWEPNLTGLQSLAAKNASANDCVDELIGGWCQTWSTFYLEESLLNQDEHKPLLSETLKRMFKEWEETPPAGRSASLISNMQRFQELFGKDEESPWCALTNFVRTLATRYMQLQDSWWQRTLEIRETLGRQATERFASQSIGVL